MQWLEQWDFAQCGIIFEYFLIYSAITYCIKQNWKKEGMHLVLQSTCVENSKLPIFKTKAARSMLWAKIKKKCLYIYSLRSSGCEITTTPNPKINIFGPEYDVQKIGT